MQHIEEAGIHSGDSACILPPHDIDPAILEEIKRQTRALAIELKVIGLMNIQFAVRDQDIYLIEVNPRASRTVPFVSKAIGMPLAKIAARIMAGKTLKELGITKDPVPKYVSAKEVVLPFIKFPGVDTLLGPEMRSTGEVMGISTDMGGAFAKSQIAAGNNIPAEGTVFLSLNERDKPMMDGLAKELTELGFTLVATKGTAAAIRETGVQVEEIFKVGEGRPNIVDRIINDEVHWIINTPLGIQSKYDEQAIRRTALEHDIPTMTTLAAAKAAVQGIQAMRNSTPAVLTIQEYHAELDNS
jgi:carbamoyl-phosphate synthase large subunit